MFKNLIIFLSLSIMIHGVVFGLFYVNSNTESLALQLPHKKNGGITISVNISRPENLVKMNPVKKIAVTKKYQEKIKEEKSKNKIQTASIQHDIKNTVTIKNNLIQNSKHQSIEKDDGETLSKILYTEFSKYFYYPKAAQRRNLQGKVILTFTIHANGAIKKIQISESSGYRLLDNAALEALKKINNRKKFIVALNGNSVEQVLPVVYQLIQ